MDNIDFINDILSRTIISTNEIISDVLFVNSNPASVEYRIIKKVNDQVQTTSEVVNYQLSSQVIHLQKISDYGLIYAVSMLLDKEFLKSFENNFCLDEAEFYPPTILRPFVKGKVQKIIDELSGSNWIITSKKVLSHLKRHKSFQDLSSDKASVIKLKGRIDDIMIFTTEDIEKDVIWRGNSKDCSAVILNDISIDKKDNIYDISVDYLFNTKGIRKLYLV